MSDATRDFLHYLPRRVIVNLPRTDSERWYQDRSGIAEGFERPVRHVTRQRDGSAAQVRPGDRIWIVSQLLSPWGRLPPGLDACIVVSSARRRTDGGFCFEATPASRWLHLTDARDLLADLTTIDAKGAIRCLWPDLIRPIGQSLQRMRRLNSAHRLEDWERQLEALPLHFISYRIADGTRLAFEKVEALLATGQKVFWDRWCLPRRLAERREVVSDLALDHHLMEQLRGASLVWGIETPLYMSPNSYAQKESSTAHQLGKYMPVYRAETPTA